jgi:glycogen debranching enzyme
MPIEIKVAPPGLTISQGRTFMVTDAKGEITLNSQQGVYAIDTRFVGFYSLSINRQPWKLVNSSQITFFSSRIYLTNPALPTEDGDVAEDSLGLTVDRYVEEGIHEDFSLTNYSRKKLKIVLNLAILCDFADLFEVKAKRFVLRGQIRSCWNEAERSLRTFYTNQDFHRALIYHILGTDVPVGFANGRIGFEIELEPGQQWHACGEMILEHGQEVKRPLSGHRGRGTYQPLVEPQPTRGSDFDKLRRHWHDSSPLLLTPNGHVYRMYRQALEDMAALRIYDLDVSEDEWVPATGVPWFVTLFGRDSLIVSLQAMVVSSGFARGALKRLSEYQARERDDYRDAQPGKILHEMRVGK